MKVTALVENTASSAQYKAIHGLSFYIETPMHKILFDVGPDDTFLKNASLLQIDISQVDAVILSHGHYDHGGGLHTFIEQNSHAVIYMSKRAFNPHYITVSLFKKYIGLDEELKDSSRIRFVGDRLRIDEELFLFSGVTPRELQSESSSSLLVKTSEGYRQDSFDHEQNLILTSGGTTCLFAGCAHSGIVNIMEEALSYNKEISHVFGGFHLHNPATGKTERAELVDAIATRLGQFPAAYYTCHCTGPKAFAQMQESLGSRMGYIRTGDIVSL